MTDKLKRVIGLEIFANELRAAEVSGSPTEISVDAHNSVFLPDGIISDGLIAKPELFMQYLKNLLAENFKAKHIVAEIISRNLILRLASFPKVAPDKQHNVVLLQAQDFIPIPLSELELSYVITGESTAEDNTVKVNALLVAMKKNIINALIDTIQNRRFGNYDINDITIGVTAFASRVAEQTKAGVFMLMYFNGATLDILIIKNRGIVMARSAQLDINITNALSKNAGAVTDDLYEKILEVIRNEYWTSVNFYNIKNNEHIDKLYFYAPHFTIKGSLSALSAELDTGVEIINIDRCLADPGSFPGKYLGCVCIAADKL